MCHLLHPYSRLHLCIQARPRFETSLSKRCSRSGIARYATISDSRHTRTASTAKEPPPFRHLYPYPAHPKPTPHQIFHLGPGATQQEIKERYYDLVRVHHPDSSHARLSTHEAHSRFRSIKAAYDFLRGRTLSPDPNAGPTPSPHNFDPYMHEMARRRRAYNASRDSFNQTTWAEGFGAPKQDRSEWNENGRKERFILLFGVLALVGGLFPALPVTLVSIVFPISTLPPSSSTSATQSDSLSSVSFSLLGLNKTHRAAAALSEARQEARDMGVERREGVRKRVKEMEKETRKP